MRHYILPHGFFVVWGLSISWAAVAHADKVVENLQKQVSTLKANVENSESERDFSAEQEEFNRMREQLLAAENAILENKALPVSAESESESAAKSKTVSASYTYKGNDEVKKPTQTGKIDDDFVESVELDARAAIAKNAIDNTNQEYELLKSKYQSALASLAAKDKEIKNIKSQKVPVENPSTVTNEKIAALQKELQVTKNKLLVSEAEVERLSALAGSGSKYARLPAPAPGRNVYSTATKNSNTQQKAESNDLSILTVIASKAYLRTGPGKDNSPLMEVKSGTRLAVEDRQGEWFRVTTPTGTRAWIASEVVALGTNSRTSSSQTVKMKSYNRSDDQIDEKAFELINKRAR